MSDPRTPDESSPSTGSQETPPPAANDPFVPPSAPSEPTSPYAPPAGPSAPGSDNAPSDPYAAPAGAPYAAPVGDPYAIPPASTYAPSAPYTPSGAARKSPVLSIISMILGILGVLGGFVAFIPVAGPFLQIWFPAAAVVLGFLGLKRERQAKGFWLTGLITGFVGLGILLLGILFTVWIFADSNSYYY